MISVTFIFAVSTQRHRPCIAAYVMRYVAVGICMCLAILWSGDPVQANSQTFDAQYLEWKQKQQWHDQQFQQGNARLAGTLTPSKGTFTSAMPLTGMEQQVSLNQATAEQLQQALTGIGLKKAQAIVEYRQKIGGFQRIEQLLEVKGIGAKTLEKNRHKLRL